MSPEVYAILERIGEIAGAAEKTASAAMQGKVLPVNAANHLIGVASYIDAMSREVKDCIEKEKA